MESFIATVWENKWVISSYTMATAWVVTMSWKMKDMLVFKEATLKKVTPVIKVDCEKARLDCESRTEKLLSIRDARIDNIFAIIEKHSQTNDRMLERIIAENDKANERNQQANERNLQLILQGLHDLRNQPPNHPRTGG